MKIAIVHFNSYPCVRMRKVVNSFIQAGHSVVYIGNARDGRYITDPRLSDLSVLHMGIPTKNRSLLKLAYLPVFWLVVCWHLVFSEYDVVYGVDLDGFLPIGFLRFFSRKFREGRYSIFDVHDAYAIRYSLPLAVEYLVAALERYFSREVDLLVHVDRIRLDPLGVNVNTLIVRNIPEKRYSDQFLLTDSSRLKILLSGSLSSSRGVDFVLNAISGMDGVDILAIGDGPPDVIDKISTVANARYFGPVSSQAALEITTQVDVVIVFYDPSLLINVLACPNKIYDVMACGRIAFLNSELKISGSIVEAGFGFSVPYNDCDALRNATLLLRDNFQLRERMFACSWERFSDVGCWSQEFEPVVQQIAKLKVKIC